jgi:CO/xanthine dehydrogenase Mo-binding subunit
VVRNPWGLEKEFGDAATVPASAEVTYDQTFTIAAETNNPMGPFATVVRWDADQLTVHDATQWPMMARRTLAGVFSVPEDHVRVLVPYLGGGFGAGLRTSHGIKRSVLSNHYRFPGPGWATGQRPPRPAGLTRQ